MKNIINTKEQIEDIINLYVNELYSIPSIAYNGWVYET